MTGGMADAGGSGGSAGAAGGEPDDMPDAGSCSEAPMTLSAAVTPINLVWSVSRHNGDAMIAQRTALADAFEAFHAQLRSRVGELRVVVLSNPRWPDDAGFPYDGSDLLVDAQLEGDGVLQALLTEFGAYSPGLIAGAPLHVVGMAERDSSLPGDSPEARAASFRQDLALLFETETGSAPPLTFHAIASEGGADDDGCTLVEDCCDGAHDDHPACASATLLCIGAPAPARMPGPGPTYFAEASATGGAQVSICEADLGDALTPIADAIAAAAGGCRYPLAAAGGVGATPVVRAAGQALQMVAALDDCTGSDQLYLEGGDLVLCPAACTRVGGSELHVEASCP
jgi:hypothetical protein